MISVVMTAATLVVPAVAIRGSGEGPRPRATEPGPVAVGMSTWMTGRVFSRCGWQLFWAGFA